MAKYINIKKIEYLYFIYKAKSIEININNFDI